MNIKLNGQPHSLPKNNPTILETLDFLGLDSEGKGIAIAVNWTVIPRGEWPTTQLNEQDELEVITARQGG